VTISAAPALDHRRQQLARQVEQGDDVDAKVALQLDGIGGQNVPNDPDTAL
jgi:hypothetical protein